MAIEFAGWLYNNTGAAISGATVELFPRNTTTTSSESTTTSSTGYFSMTESTEGRYDVRITSGSSVRFIKYDTSMQFQEMEAHEVHFRGPNNAYTTDLVGSDVAANRVLTIPLITGSDTLATLGLAATFSAVMTHSADIIIQDASDLALGTGSDALLRWSTGDADNHSLVVALGNSNQGLHVTDVAAVATDWALAATTHPNVYIHSNTTPASDYLRLGDHDGTTAYIDVVGGTTLAFEVAGTTEMSMTASALDISGLALTNDDDDEIRMGTGGDWSLLWSDADADNHAAVIAIGDSSQALHITDYSAKATDWNIAAATHPNLYIHSNTTPATDFLRLGDHDGTTAYIDVVGGTTLALEIAGNTELTVTASGLNVPANSDILFTGSTGTNDINLTDSLADALSIVRGSTDMVVFDSNTPRITFTPATTFTGAITGPSGTWDSGGMDIAASDSYAVAGTDILSDSSGTMTLSNVDALDATTEATIEAAIDTLANLTAASALVTVSALSSGSIASGFGSIVATTIDATTDFTIGATVITDGVLTDAGGFQMAAVLDMNNNAINNIGAAGHDFGASGLILADAGAYLGWQDTTNAGVQGAGEVGGSVSVADGETFTFTMGGDGCVFQLIQRTGGLSNAGVGGLFFATYENATIIELADPTGKYVVGGQDDSPPGTDAGDNWAVFKDAGSNVVSVKNYRNATVGMSVVVLGSVASATAPA